MNQTSVSPAASRLGASHGYQFVGDFVRINAEIHFSDSDLLAGQPWALQLWANAANASDLTASGIKVAELAITPQNGPLLVNGDCLARLPAGCGEQSLGLALVTWGSDGLPEVRDLAAYAQAECFSQPGLNGKVSCDWSDAGIELRIDAIGNPRTPENLSGTLALEVWALDTPYAGGSWQGVPVAAFVLGTLAGGEQWLDCSYRAAAIRPGKAACLTVMLREWTAEGYLTRDFRNLPAAEPVVSDAIAAEPVVEAAPEVAAEVVQEVTPAPAAVEAVAVEAEAKADTKSEVKAEVKAEAGKVSINTASEEELFALKGVSASLARHIIAARPYAAVDELCRAKGMGPKLLPKLRQFFCL